MERKVKNFIYFLFIFRFALTLWVVILIAIPWEYYINNKSFTIEDIKVWESPRFVSTRLSRWDYSWIVIQEITQEIDWVYYTPYRGEREVLAEKWLKTVSRVINYTHYNTWRYVLHIHGDFKTEWLWLEKDFDLVAEYNVVE